MSITVARPAATQAAHPDATLVRGLRARDEGAHLTVDLHRGQRRSTRP